jgi:FkbM family methyltransferase
MSVFVRAYAIARRVGVTERPWFDDVFARAYFAYKRWIEDPFHDLCARRPELFRGGHVIDVGANIGYTATVFARAVEPGWNVYAFEPEAGNFALMERVLRRHHVADRVIAVRAAAGAADGASSLTINPDHHGDHRIGPGVPVAMRSVDSFTDGLARREIAFVKIDVQGYELEVVRGMTRVLDANPKIAVAFEHARGASDEILRFFEQRGFAIEEIARRRDYADLLARRPS